MYAPVTSQHISTGRDAVKMEKEIHVGFTS